MYSLDCPVQLQDIQFVNAARNVPAIVATVQPVQTACHGGTAHKYDIITSLATNVHQLLR